MTVALAGFATIGAFLILVLGLRAPVILALVTVPVVAALLLGQGNLLDRMALDGLKTVAPIAAMMMFAILYFGLMIDTGLFDPLIKALVGLIHGDPVRLCLVTAALPMLVALDGDGATTFLISITALLPVHRRLKLDPLVLPTIIGLSAGVMNLLPWGGPTARAMASLGTDARGIFTPILPAMAAGVAWVFASAWWLGHRERKRLAAIAMPPEPEPEETGRDAPRNTGCFAFNLVLTLLLLLLLFQDLYRAWLPVPPLPAALLFMLAFAIALPVNIRSAAQQQERLTAHAGTVLTVTSMIFGAGLFTGILNGSGMTGAMARQMAAVIPDPLLAWLPQIVAVTGMPLSLLFTPDAYYFGVLPIFATTAETAGQDPLAIGRAAILGQMTTGFPLSPLTASTFILVGLSGVSLRDHQRRMFPWAMGTTLIMTLIASVTGAL